MVGAQKLLRFSVKAWFPNSTARNKNAQGDGKSFLNRGTVEAHLRPHQFIICEEESINKMSGTLKLNSRSKMKTINFGEKKLLVQMKVHGLIKLGNENT